MSGHEPLEPASTLASADFWGHFHSVPARTKGKTEGFLKALELCGSPPYPRPPHRSWCPKAPGGADGRDRRESCCTRSLLSRLVWYSLASASYKGGTTAMAFGQVQGGMRGCPSPPPGTDTFKRSRATRTQHRREQRVPPPEQDGRSRPVSQDSPPRPGPARAPPLAPP